MSVSKPVEKFMNDFYGKGLRKRWSYLVREEVVTKPVVEGNLEIGNFRVHNSALLAKDFGVSTLSLLTPLV